HSQNGHPAALDIREGRQLYTAAAISFWIPRIDDFANRDRWRPAGRRPGRCAGREFGDVAASRREPVQRLGYDVAAGDFGCYAVNLNDPAGPESDIARRGRLHG